MPGFVRTKKDEARWSKAKQQVSASKDKSDSEFDDRDWALANHIYHSMMKAALGQHASELIKKCRAAKTKDEFNSHMQELIKVRRNIDDEPSYEDMDPEDLESMGMREFDPSEEESDDAMKWLEENDPEKGKEYGQDENVDEESATEPETIDDEPEEPSAESPSRSKASAGTKEQDVSQGDPSQRGQAPSQEKVKRERFPQPSREELAEMREHTQPWERYQRERSRLEADPLKNPVLHHNGRLIEARNEAHGGFQQAYNAMTSSDQYKNADPISQMEMDDKFKKDWHEKNPEHHSKAMQLHSEAHGKGMEAKGAFEAEKEAKIQDILRGGTTAMNPDMTEEAAYQHAGGTKGEEGTSIAIEKRPAAAFASGHKQFLEQFGSERAKRAKQPKTSEEMISYDQGARKDANDVLGNPPSLQDPQKKMKFDQFFGRYYPLIAINAHKVVSKLGLDKAKVDHGMLHEAGMYGLFQAMNDYDHDHPSKASFSTHANRKINGLMMTALRSQQTEVPEDVRRKAKIYEKQQQQAKVPTEPKSQAVSAPSPAPPPIPEVKATEAPKPPTELVGQMKGSQKDRISDALKRVDAARSSIIRRPGGTK